MTACARGWHEHRRADPPQPSGYDWSARVRTTALEALRYSRFVALMKRLLSLGAFLIIAAVLAFFFVQRMPRQLQMSYERLGHIENDLAMVKPRLTGADAKGNPFVITADCRGPGCPQSQDAPACKNLEADLTLDKQNWLNARAAHGHGRHGHRPAGADRRHRCLHRPPAMSCTPAAPRPISSRASIHGHEPVTGQGPQGTLRADEFHADRATNLLTLSGHVHMTLIGSKEMKQRR